MSVRIGGRLNMKPHPEKPQSDFFAGAVTLLFILALLAFPFVVVWWHSLHPKD